MSSMGATPENEQGNSAGEHTAIIEMVERLPSPAQRTRVTEAMTVPVVSVEPKMEIPEPLRLFVERGVSGAPVVDVDGTPLGIGLNAQTSGPIVVERHGWPTSRNGAGDDCQPDEVPACFGRINNLSTKSRALLAFVIILWGLRVPAKLAARP